MEWWLTYLALGGFVGFFAGLLGIGGGMTMVPMLVLIFSALDFPESHVVHLALGTAMASILFTSVASLRAHHGHDAVVWPAVRAMAPGVIIGTLSGTVLAGRLPTKPLAVFFAAFVFYAGTRMLLDVKAKPSHELPGKPVMFAAGALIGAISSLVAAGGAVLTVPFLMRSNVSLHHAIGTSAAVGFPIAIAGTLGYVLNGLWEERLPPYSLGFVYLPALFWLVAASIFTAPVGARVAHRTRTGPLRKTFALLLFILATRMVVSLM
jgi:uncharacterized protein